MSVLPCVHINIDVEHIGWVKLETIFRTFGKMMDGMGATSTFLGNVVYHSKVSTIREIQGVADGGLEKVIDTVLFSRSMCGRILNFVDRTAMLLDRGRELRGVSSSPGLLDSGFSSTSMCSNFFPVPL